VKIAPNPAITTLQIQSNRNQSKPLFYQIFDITGKLLLTGISDKDIFSINVQKLSAGIYIIKLFNGYQVNLLTEKFEVN
jgi:hypothetical protein